MPEVKRYYSRVNGARFVFQDGHDCFFPNHYYETSDPREIHELDALCRFDNNPLVFVSRDNSIPSFGSVPQAYTIQPVDKPAPDADALFALTLAIANAAEKKQPLVYDSLPDNVKAQATPELLDRMNQLLAMQVGGEVIPPVAKDPAAPTVDATTAALAALEQFKIPEPPVSAPPPATESQ